MACFAVYFMLMGIGCVTGLVVRNKFVNTEIPDLYIFL